MKSFIASVAALVVIAIVTAVVPRRDGPFLGQYLLDHERPALAASRSAGHQDTLLILRQAQHEGLTLSLSTLLRPPKRASRRREGEGRFGVSSALFRRRPEGFDARRAKT